MNYLKIYLDIMCRAQNRAAKDIAIKEKHHILPKSLYGSECAKRVLKINDEQSKTVYLSLREHFLSHLLLVKIFEHLDQNCYQRMLFAVNLMKSRNSSSQKYQWEKEKYRKMMSMYLTGKPSRAKGKKWTTEAKYLKSKNHYMKGKTYEEIYGTDEANRLRNIRSDKRKGKTYEEVYGIDKAKHAKTALKKPKTVEHKRKLSEYRKGKKMNEETKEKISKTLKETNGCIDHTIYGFRNKKTGMVVYARQIDMKRQYGCRLMHRIMRDQTKSTKGWMFTGEIKEK